MENRIVRNSGYLAWAYSYAPGNKRVWRGAWTVDNNLNYTQTLDEITYWSATGQKLATYQLSAYGSQLVATATGTNQYFGGKLIKNAGGYVTPDRLGSIGKYFPYGQERPSATQDGKEKFATYFRDSETGLDYAPDRYHQPGMGRFMTPDPSSGSVSPKDPGSWNRYAYTGGDPVNRSDPGGLDWAYDGSDWYQTFDADCTDTAFVCGYWYGVSQTGQAPAGYLPSIFASDLGQIGSGGGNEPTALSSAYDLNNSAPGFGGNTVPTNSVNNAYQLACQYATNPCTDSDPVNAQNVGGTVNVILTGNPLDANAVGNCWQDPLSAIFHPGSPNSYYCGGNYFGDTSHLVIDPNNTPSSTGAHYDDPGPLNPLHWFWSFFAWASDPSQNFTCSVASGCTANP